METDSIIITVIAKVVITLKAPLNPVIAPHHVPALAL